jgi:DNA modification methylase
MELNIIHNENCLTGLKRYPDNFFHCCVTSPPYWGLRDYGVDGQLGLEATPEELICKLVQVFREVHRVLRNDGTLWLNVGDSYAHNGAAYHSEKSTLIGRKQGEEMGKAKRFVKSGSGLKPKDLVGIPWMLAFALRADGWYLRDCIIWHKPNPMPESVTDRTTKAHEYIFLLSKSAKYYYNAAAIATPYADKTYTTFGLVLKGNGDGTGLIASENWGNSTPIRKPKECKMPMDGREKGKKFDKQRGHSRRHAGFNERWDNMSKEEQQFYGANKRSVWTMATRPFKEAHFATFPEELPYTCILAGSPMGGGILDPFMGAGTTALVARKLQRNYVGFELNPKYVKMAEKRLKKELGMFL